MSAGRLFDRAPLRHDSLFIGLTLFARAIIDVTRQMRNLRAMRADSALVWLGIRVHAQTLPPFNGDETIQARRGRILPVSDPPGVFRKPTQGMADNSVSLAVLIRTVTHASLASAPPKYCSHWARAFWRRRQNRLSSARSSPAISSISAASS